MSESVNSFLPSNSRLSQIKAAIAQYEYFIERLIKDDNSVITPIVSINISGDFEIDCYWGPPSGFLLDLGFKGDGVYSYYAKLPDGRELIEDESPYTDPLPSEILVHLQKGKKS